MPCNVRQLPGSGRAFEDGAFKWRYGRLDSGPNGPIYILGWRLRCG
jgi:hypothetical protein